MIKIDHPHQESELRQHCHVTVYDPVQRPWDSIADEIVELDRMHFGDQAFDAELFKQSFLNPENTAVIITDETTNKIVGFTFASPADVVYETYNENPDYFDRKKDGQAAYIGDTVIHPQYMKHHLVGEMMRLLESKLKEKGFKYLERDSSVNNNYADNIRKNYSGKIEEEQLHDSEFGPQVFFRIRL